MQVVNKQFRKITAGITRLGTFQLANGGLPYWQGNAVADDWGLLRWTFGREKKDMFAINFKSKWISYQQEAKQWRFYRNMVMI
jgi:hypothetical protein